jgi:DNA-binding NarL/FixJ family response regulator
MAAGIEGFVLKRRAVTDLILAIREVLQGHKYISPDVDVVS